MLPQIAVLVGAVILGILVFAFFAHDIIAVVLNGILIYLITIRVYAEVRKRKEWTDVYVVSGLISLAVVVFWNPFPLWQLTSFMILAFVLGQAWMYTKKR